MTKKLSGTGSDQGWDDAPRPKASDPKTVRLSREAINQASKIVPIDAWIDVGICNWLQSAADHVFQSLPEGTMETRYKKTMKYVFQFSEHGTVLKSVSL